MSIRLIASDVDGTILPRGGKISDRTRAAVHACEAAGIHFVIASGRWYVSARTIADCLEMERGYMIISGGGAVVRMDGTPLMQWRMFRAQAERVYEIARRENVMINAFVPDAVYRVNTAALRQPVRGLGDYLGGQYHMVNDDRTLFEEKGLECPYKMEVYGEDAQTLAALRETLVREGLTVTSSFHTNLEILAPGCGKGTALKWLMRDLGIEPEACMAFGDNGNDLSLLQASGWPVAVGNAVDALKRVARRVAGNCECDGVAEVIEQVIGGKFV